MQIDTVQNYTTTVIYYHNDIRYIVSKPDVLSISINFPVDLVVDAAGLRRSM